MADEITSAFRSTFRDFKTDGVPSSGKKRTSKKDARSIGPVIQSSVDSLSTRTSVLEATSSGNQSAIAAESAARQAAITAEQTARSGADNGLDARLTAVEAIATTGIANRVDVEVATTGNITLSGEQTIDGVTTSASRVLVKNQTAASQNGAYVTGSGSWTRATDADASAELEGLAVFVAGGTTQADTTWYCTATSITVGTTALPFVLMGKGAVGLSSSDDNDVKGQPAATAVSDADGRAVTYVDAAGRDHGQRGGYGDFQAGEGELSYDVIIYGGSLSALMAAKEVRRAGLTAAIIDPYGLVGGTVSHGLVWTDFPPAANRGAVCGPARSFFQSIIGHYADRNELTRTQVFTESGTTYYSLGGRIFPPESFLQAYDPRAFAAQWLREALEAGIRVIPNSPIFGAEHVLVQSGRIRAMRTAAGWARADWFIDASNEGDLIRASGAPFRIGREAASEFDERIAGFMPSAAFLTTGLDLTTVNTDRLETYPTGLSEGDADERVQAGSFRLLITQDAKRIPFRKPAGYNKADFKIVGHIQKVKGYTRLLSAVANQGVLVNVDGVVCVQTNTGAGLSNELPTAGTDYAYGNWSRRRAVIDDQAYWQQGILYYLAHDCAADYPELSNLQTDAATWGYAPGLWTDSPYGEGFPPWWYTREALRLKGSYTMAEQDMHDLGSGNATSLRNSRKSSAVFQYNYSFDAHACRIYRGQDAAFNTTICFEGPPIATYHPSEFYDIPMGCLFTDYNAAGHRSNLLVSVCMSTTHGAWMNMRMEPAFAMAGTVCGTMAAIAIERELSDVKDINYTWVRDQLDAIGQTLIEV